MYSDVFCKVYNEFGWNYYPEAFGEQLLKWLAAGGVRPKTALDLACGTGVLCEIMDRSGIEASGMDFSAGMIDIAARRSPQIRYEVADMITYRPDRQYDLVTCTGDALNHIGSLSDVEKIFSNVHDYLSPGGFFVFDILNENEVSTSEPFEMDFSDTVRVWFRMIRPGEDMVQLQIRVFEAGVLSFEEHITEKVHDPQTVCDLLRQAGFRVLKCADTLLDDPDAYGTTWFVIARKE